MTPIQNTGLLDPIRYSSQTNCSVYQRMIGWCLKIYHR